MKLFLKAGNAKANHAMQKKQPNHSPRDCGYAKGMKKCLKKKYKNEPLVALLIPQLSLPPTPVSMPHDNIVIQHTSPEGITI